MGFYADPEFHVISKLPLSSLDEAVLTGITFVATFSRDVRAFELDQLGKLIEFSAFVSNVLWF